MTAILAIAVMPSDGRREAMSGTARLVAGRSCSAVGTPAAGWRATSKSRGATIVSADNFMLFTPMLPEAASGTLEPRHAVVPLRMMCPHAELVLGRAVALDETSARRVTVKTEVGAQSRSSTATS